MNRYIRRADVTEHDMGNVTFLATREKGTVIELNETAAALWRLLEKPITEVEAANIIHQAWPDIPLDQALCDVNKLFRRFLARGLIAEEA